MLTLWISEACFSLETHSRLDLVWSHELNAHLQLEHIFQFSYISKEPRSQTARLLHGVNQSTVSRANQEY